MKEMRRKKQPSSYRQKYKYKVISLFLVLYSRFLSPKRYQSSGGKVHTQRSLNYDLKLIKTKFHGNNT